MKRERTPPINLYVPFDTVERRDDGYFVSGYAFVNEVVPGEGGIRLHRLAMEEATPEYMRFANVREMHSRNAAGVTTEALWDEKGCKITAKVVDPIARLKCEEGVYKGFSVGVHPLVVRGKDVHKVSWFETSLVDRPRDPDAVFSLFRMEGFDPTAQETVVLEGEEPVPESLPAGLDGTGSSGTTERGISSQTRDLPIRENLEGTPKCPVCGTRCACCAEKMSATGSYRTEEPPLTRIIRHEDDKWVVYSHDGEKKLGTYDSKEEAEERLAQIEYFKHKERVERALLPDILGLEEERDALLTRAQTAETEIARVQGEHEAAATALAEARERITVLESTPPERGPVLHTDQFRAADRQFAANLGPGAAAAQKRRTEILERIAQLTSEVPKDQTRQVAAATEVNTLRWELSRLQA